jgi:hypothetical protein
MYLLETKKNIKLFVQSEGLFCVCYTPTGSATEKVFSIRTYISANYETEKHLYFSIVSLPTDSVIVDHAVLLGTNYFGRQSQLTDIKQAFFTTVNHCHCQTHHCKMLNTEKLTTEGDIPRRKN